MTEFYLLLDKIKLILESLLSCRKQKVQAEAVIKNDTKIFTVLGAQMSCASTVSGPIIITSVLE